MGFERQSLSLNLLNQAASTYPLTFSIVTFFDIRHYGRLFGNVLLGAAKHYTCFLNSPKKGYNVSERAGKDTTLFLGGVVNIVSTAMNLALV